MLQGCTVQHGAHSQYFEITVKKWNELLNIYTLNFDSIPNMVNIDKH